MTWENGAPAHEQVQLALERILISRLFVQSSRLSRFLRFVVEHALKGKTEELKEYTIATKVYDRGSDFDPAQDSIVRSEARRLRRKLKEYYDTEGRADETVILFTPGSYIPAHRFRKSCCNFISPSLVSRGHLNAFTEDVFISVELFESSSANGLASEYALGISDELLYRLVYFTSTGFIYGTTRSSSERCSLDGTHEPRIAIGGTVRAHDNLLRVTVRMTIAGRIIWLHRVDSALESNTLIHLQESVAANIVDHLVPWFAKMQGVESSSVLASSSAYTDSFSGSGLSDTGKVSSAQQIV